MAVCLALLVVDVSSPSHGAAAVDRAVHDWTLIAINAFAAGAYLVRVTTRRGERKPWVLLAIGWAAYAAGGAVYNLLGHQAFPSAADPLWLAFYPFSAAGLVLLARQRHATAPLTTWLDGAIGAVALAAVGAAFVFDPALARLGDAQAVAVVYPLLDLLLLGLVAVLGASRGWGLDRTWTCIGLGVALFAAADCVYLYETAHRGWAPGNALDVPYALGTLLMVAGAWQGAAALPRRDELDARMFTVPMSFSVLAVALTVYEFSAPSPMAIVLTVTTLLLVVARLGVTFHAYARVLASSRYEALYDAITGLGNRRKLMRDLDDVVADDESVLVAIFDLDGFKHYNDSFGHAAGDALLVLLSAALAAAARALGGLAYRMGGDEFCVLLPDGSELAVIETALREEGKGFSVDSSHGGARVPAEAPHASAALRLADQRMYAAKNARPVSASSQTRDLLVRVLAEREPDLHDHVIDVGLLAVQVAAELDVPEHQHAEIVHGAELHDVGKIAIPESILHKAGPLDEDEWVYMKRHTLVGERFLLSVPALRGVGRLVRSSHERWDGAGYPDGLAGEEIPLGARIIAVCDAYDAMVTDRPYRRATDQASALSELRRCSGSQFDPRVVDAFCAVAARATTDTVVSAA